MLVKLNLFISQTEIHKCLGFKALLICCRRPRQHELYPRERARLYLGLPCCSASWVLACLDTALASWPCITSPPHTFCDEASWQRQEKGLKVHTHHLYTLKLGWSSNRLCILSYIYFCSNQLKFVITATLCWSWSSWFGCEGGRSSARLFQTCSRI